MAYLNPALTAKRTSQQVAASYRHGANEVSINYSGGFRDSDKEYSHKEEEYIGGGNVTRLYYHGLPSTTIDRYNSLRIDYTRQPSDKRIFIASLLLDQHSQNQDEDTEVQEISSSYTERTSRDFKSLAPTFDLYYRENTSANGVMELNVTTSLSRGDYYRDIFNTTGYSDLNKINNTAWFIGGEALYSPPLLVGKHPIRNPIPIHQLRPKDHDKQRQPDCRRCKFACLLRLRLNRRTTARHRLLVCCRTSLQSCHKLNAKTQPSLCR